MSRHLIGIRELAVTAVVAEAAAVAATATARLAQKKVRVLLPTKRTNT